MVSHQARSNAFHEWRRRSRGEPSLPGGAIRSVLVVCEGNICRSPFAGVLLATLNPGLVVRSAGLAASAGSPADPTAVRIAAGFGLDLAHHAARPLVANDMDWADLILGMEGHQAVRIHREWPRAGGKIRLLGDYLPSPPYTIHDPWGREDEVFVETFERIAVAARRLAERLAAEGPWPSGGS